MSLCVFVGKQAHKKAEKCENLHDLLDALGGILTCDMMWSDVHVFKS